jgi:hypothetical protein
VVANCLSPVGIGRGRAWRAEGEGWKAAPREDVRVETREEREVSQRVVWPVKGRGAELAEAEGYDGTMS